MAKRSTVQTREFKRVAKICGKVKGKSAKKACWRTNYKKGGK